MKNLSLDSEEKKILKDKGKSFSILSEIFPFFSSAFLFMSGIFILFTPLPLLVYRFQKPARLVTLAILSNSILVAFMRGDVGVGFFVALAFPIVLLMPELLKKKFSIEKTVFITWVSTVLIMILSLFIYWKMYPREIQEIKNYFSNFLDQLVQTNLEGSSSLLKTEIEDLKQKILIQLPSAGIVFALVAVVIHLSILSLINANRLFDSQHLNLNILRKWKAPEWLVWPSIGTGVFLVYHVDTLSDIAINFFNVLMTIYCFQGLCVLSSFFRALKLQKFLRILGYVLAITCLIPLVLGLGFFDLWFDFRNKFKQPYMQ